jgi:hypothetical protein
MYVHIHIGTILRSVTMDGFWIDDTARDYTL